MKKGTDTTNLDLYDRYVEQITHKKAEFDLVFNELTDLWHLRAEANPEHSDSNPVSINFASAKIQGLAATREAIQDIAEELGDEAEKSDLTDDETAELVNKFTVFGDEVDQMIQMLQPELERLKDVIEQEGNAREIEKRGLNLLNDQQLQTLIQGGYDDKEEELRTLLKQVDRPLNLAHLKILAGREQTKREVRLAKGDFTEEDLFKEREMQRREFYGFGPDEIAIDCGSDEQERVQKICDELGYKVRFEPSKEFPDRMVYIIKGDYDDFKRIEKFDRERE